MACWTLPSGIRRARDAARTYTCIYNWKQELWVTFTAACCVVFVANHYDPPVTLFSRQTFSNQSGQLPLQSVRMPALGKLCSPGEHAGAPKERIRSGARCWCYCCDLLWMMRANDTGASVIKKRGADMETVYSYKYRPLLNQAYRIFSFKI